MNGLVTARSALLQQLFKLWSTVTHKPQNEKKLGGDLAARSLRRVAAGRCGCEWGFFAGLASGKNASGCRASRAQPLSHLSTRATKYSLPGSSWPLETTLNGIPVLELKASTLAGILCQFSSPTSISLGPVQTGTGLGHHCCAGSRPTFSTAFKLLSMRCIMAISNCRSSTENPSKSAFSLAMANLKTAL